MAHFHINCNRGAGDFLKFIWLSQVRKLMEDCNGVREANGITLCSKGEIPYCVSRKPPLDVARPRATT